MARRLEPRPAVATTPPSTTSSTGHTAVVATTPTSPRVVAASAPSPSPSSSALAPPSAPLSCDKAVTAAPPDLHHKPKGGQYHSKHDGGEHGYDRDRDHGHDRDRTGGGKDKVRDRDRDRDYAPKKPRGAAAAGPRASPFRRWPQALFCAASIMLSLMAYSILQERIMTRPYTLPPRGLRGLQPGATARRKLDSDSALSDLDGDGDDADDADDDDAESGDARRRRRFGLGFGLGMSDAHSLNTSRATAVMREGAPRAAFFTNSLFLVLVNRLFAAGVALGCIMYRRERDDLRSSAPLVDYASISLSNVVATSCQYEALKWLTFPTVTIGKCAKMLPVMIILNVRSGRQYSCDDFGIVGVVLAGCGLMISSGNVMAKRGGSAETDTPFGFVLMLVYLLFDAITSTYQERLFTKYDMSVYNQMLYMNVTSAGMSFAALAVSGGLLGSLRFVAAFPAVLRDIVMLSMSAVGGQFAITYTIQSFGALLYAGIMTTRQFFSVLASDVIFKHGLNRMQWTGALMVFSALFYKLYRKAVQSTA